jgi:Holliday junction DNA helicase RuvA
MTMFAYLKGILVQKDPTSIILEVNGVGYQLAIPLSTFEKLPHLNQPVKLLTYFQVREDLQALYGFYSREEKDLFLKLINVTGIGPKMAVTILSGASPEQFRNRIIAGDVRALTLIPGIGSKTAQRIIVELREKLVGDDVKIPEDMMPMFETGYNDEALKALISLGYRRSEALNSIKRAARELGPDAPVEKIIKAALNKM